jgi:hypothetical protein
MSAPLHYATGVHEMRHVLGLLGVVAAAILLLVSASMNWSFGYSLGKSEFESQLFGAASAAADTLKALLPFFIFGALRNRNRAQAAAGVLLMAVCFIYSLTSSLGFATVNRADSTRARLQQTEKHQLLVTEGDRIFADLSQVNKDLERPVEIVSDASAPLADPIAAKLEAYKQNTFWKSSNECAAAPGKQSREYCQGYFELMSEHDAAIKRDAEERARSLSERVKTAAERRTRLEDRRNDLERQRAENLGKLSSEKKENAIGAADPQVELLASLVGATPNQMKKALPILVALLVELGSSLGFFVAFSYWRILEQETKPIPAAAAPKAEEPVVRRPAPAPTERLRDHQPKNDVEMFFDERVAREEGQSVTALALYDDYCNWCDAKSKQPFGLPIFGRHLNELGVQKAKIAGRIRYIGVRMLFAEEDEIAREMAAAS